MELTPPIINNPPVGVLGFLGMKNGGRNPDALSNVVAPTLDMLPWMRWQSRTFDAAMIPVAALGAQTGTLVVPNGECWLLEQLGVHISATLGAGQSIRIAPAAFQGGTTVSLFVGPMASATVGERLFLHWTPPVPIVLAPGTIIGVQVEALAAGPINVIARATFHRASV